MAGILALSFFGSKGWRLWAPVVGILVGTLVSWLFGQLDTTSIREAAWVGLPDLSWTGFDLSFNQNFWVLLPAFLIVTVVGAIETYGDCIAVQRISNRTEKPTDYRVVQGALYADGLGNLLSGCAGTMPNTTYSTSISVVDMTGVASRRVGLLCGLFMVLLAFFPKLAASILALPEPVVGSYLLVLILLLFMHGIRMVAADGLSYEKGFIVGMGFWLGAGFQQQAIFNASIPDWLSPILSNGMTSGTMVTLILVAFLGLRKGRKKTLNTHLATEAVTEVQEFIADFCRARRWDEQMTYKLQLAAEEAMLGLMDIRSQADDRNSDSLRFELRTSHGAVEMDIAVASVDLNLENLVKSARKSVEPSEGQLPFQILGLVTQSLTHFQYHGLDFVSMVIAAPQRAQTAGGLH